MCVLLYPDVIRNNDPMTRIVTMMMRSIVSGFSQIYPLKMCRIISITIAKNTKTSPDIMSSF